MSQEKVSVLYTDLPLRDIIVDIEKRFDIKLSYNSELIDSFLISFQSDEASLQDIFSAIEEQTNIEFDKVDKRYYIIKKQPKVDLSKTQQLDEILISEYLTTGIREGQDKSITVSPKELGILPGLTEPDVLQSIQLLPGVQSPTETASGLYVRGGTPDQNLILWDGIKMYNSGHFFGTISAFNPYITDEIKLFKSGTKARYGNRVSSVIDISSDNKIPESIKGGFGFNMTHIDAYFKAPISKKVAILVSGRRSFTEIFNTATFKNLAKRVFQNTKISQGNKVFDDDEVMTTKDLFYFSDFTLKAIIKPNEKDEITFSNLFTKNKLDYGFLIEEFGEASQDKLDVNNAGSTIAWKHKYSKTFSHTFSTYYSNFDLQYVGTNSIENEFNDKLEKQNRIDDLGFSFHTDWKINTSNTISFGYQFSSNKVKYVLTFLDSESEEDEFLETNIDTNNSHAFYSDYEYRKEDKWYINGGLRANHISVLNKFYLEPRFQFGFKPHPDLKIKISAESLHQAVSQIVEFNTEDFGLENQIWALSDDELIPLLKSSQLTTGFVFSKNGWTLDTEAYYKKIDGLTSFTLGFDSANELTFTKGNSRVLGLDVLLKKKIDNYRTWLSYSLVNNKFTFREINNGNSFPGNFDITNQLIWSHSYEWDNFNVSLGWSIRTGIPFTKAFGLIETNEGVFIDFGEINNSRLPNYHRLDASATYKFNVSKNKRWKGKLGFSLLNIYNKENILSRTYLIRQSSEDGSNLLREINKSSLGITPNVVFRIEF
ncbi:MAG: TonB-dependent receptor [Flavobacteriaceae bacterium]|nr:TonB-dependent receptor [Flavobacteriaceae bacterium]